MLSVDGGSSNERIRIVVHEDFEGPFAVHHEEAFRALRWLGSVGQLSRVSTGIYSCGTEATHQPITIHPLAPGGLAPVAPVAR